MLAFAVVMLLSAMAATYFAVTERWFSEDNTATPVLPDRATNEEYYAFGCTDMLGGNQLDASDWGPVFTPQYTIRMTEFDMRLGRKDNGDRVYWIRVHEASGMNRGTYLGISEGIPINSIAEDTYPGHQPWTTFTFDGGLYLYSNTTYILTFYITGSTGRCYMEVPYNTACIGAVSKGHYPGGNPWTTTNTFDYMVKGYVGTEPDVETTGHVINLDGSVTLKGWAEVIGDMECGFIVSDDYAEVLAGTGMKYSDDQSGWNAGRFPFDYRLTSLQNDVEYSYRAYASAYTSTWYGNVLNFTRSASDIPLTLSCNVIRNDINGVTFESSSAGINSTGNVTYNMTIAYGVNMTQCQAGTGTISVASLITADGIWQTTSTYGSDFDPGGQYWYRLVAAGNDSSLGYSTARSFTAYDESAPDWLQRLLAWLNDRGGMNTSLDTATWWIVGLLFLGAWILAGVLHWKWLGIVGTAAIFVWLVVNNMVPVWVVILAVLVAGWIIFKLVFTRAHEETGD